nr:DNA (cytosine-5-)-methyltransferase [Endozoicomonas arenosclerae]
MKVLDLFSGIGGFSLGLERAGMKTIAFCEIEPYCRKVLKKHWPDVPIFEDIKELTADDLPEYPDVICGGFPCQDLSGAGRQDGIEGSRSGLYTEMLRLVSECRPKYTIFENVTDLLTGGGGSGSRSFSMTWPRSGRMQNGTVYQLPNLARRTIEIASGLLLTPTAQTEKAYTFRNPYALIRKNHADGNIQEQLMRVYKRMITPDCAQILMMYPNGWASLKRTEML